jgi:hypothetical protein
MYDNFNLMYPDYELRITRAEPGDPWDWTVLDKQLRMLGQSSEYAEIDNFMDAVREGSAFIANLME